MSRYCGNLCAIWDQAESYAAVTFLQVPQPVKAGTQLATLEGCKAELTSPGYIPRWYSQPRIVTHPSTIWVQCRVISFVQQTTLPLCQTASQVLIIVNIDIYGEIY